MAPPSRSINTLATNHPAAPSTPQTTGTQNKAAGSQFPTPGKAVEDSTHNPPVPPDFPWDDS
jgi:hypothetical protein